METERELRLQRLRPTRLRILALAVAGIGWTYALEDPRTADSLTARTSSRQEGTSVAPAGALRETQTRRMLVRRGRDAWYADDEGGTWLCVDEADAGGACFCVVSGMDRVMPFEGQVVDVTASFTAPESGSEFGRADVVAVGRVPATSTVERRLTSAGEPEPSLRTGTIGVARGSVCARRAAEPSGGICPSAPATANRAHHPVWRAKVSKVPSPNIVSAACQPASGDLDNPYD